MKDDTDKDLIRARERDYEILCVPEAGEMLTLFGKLVIDVSPREKEGDSVCRDGVRRTLFHDGRCRCRLVEYGGKKYILKLDKRDRHRFDYLVQSFFLGSNAFRLLKTLHRAAKHGFDGAARIFLVADKRRFGCTLHSFFLQEYVEGETLQETPPEFYRKYANEAAGIIYALHEFGCAHGDAHRGNFILEKKSGKLKVIDVGGKVPYASQKATDRLRLQKEWGVKNTVFDHGYVIAVAYRSWRHLLDALRRKFRKPAA